MLGESRASLSPALLSRLCARADRRAARASPAVSMGLLDDEVPLGRAGLDDLWADDDEDEGPSAEQQRKALLAAGASLTRCPR